MPFVGVGASPPRGGDTGFPRPPLSAVQAWVGGKSEAPELQKNWSSGWRTKVSERAPQLGGGAGAGPASDAPGLLPVLVTAPGASPPSAMQARPTPGAPQKLVPSQPQSHQQYASPRPGSPPPPSSPATVVAHRPAASREPAEGSGLPAAPPGRRRPPGRIKVRRAGRGGCSHRAAPNARPPAPAPRVGTPRIPCGGGLAPSSPCFPTREGLESM